MGPSRRGWLVGGLFLAGVGCAQGHVADPFKVGLCGSACDSGTDPIEPADAAPADAGRDGPADAAPADAGRDGPDDATVHADAGRDGPDDATVHADAGLCDGVDCSDYEPAAAETGECNVPKCNPETGLCERVLVPAATVCDDGLFCTVNDVCDGAGSCTGETLSCSDNVDCTSDMCDEETDSCTHQITIGGCREAACTPGADADSDGTDDCVDNCPGVTNRAQGDADGDGIGNACEACNDPRFDYTNDGDVDDGDRVVFENCMRSDGQYGMAIDVCACSDITYDDHVDAEDLGWFIACYVTGGAADPSCDDLDHCPADPYKAVPGACGCGVADTDSDGDALPDCEDTCTDTDGDTFGNPGFTISGCAGSTTVPDNCPDIANPPPTFDPTHQGDIDGDDIGNACEACNDPRFDVTGDHIVTVLDHNYWQTCFNGPNQPYALSAIDRDACACMDADHDDDLDGADYLRFQSCLDPGDDPTCDD